MSSAKPLRPVARCLCVKGDTVLASKDETTGRYWLPGGGVEAGETAKTAAMRELKEETGRTGYVDRSWTPGEKDELEWKWTQPASELDEGMKKLRAEFSGERLTLVPMSAGDAGKASPEPGEEDNVYTWLPVAEVMGETSGNSEVQRMLDFRAEAIRRLLPNPVGQVKNAHAQRLLAYALRLV